MKVLVTLCFSLLIMLGVNAQSVSYELSMENPQSHYFHVTMNLEGFKEDSILIKMPVWAPGSYLIREFPKNVNLVYAFNEQGKPLDVKKSTKNSWFVKRDGAKKIRVSYDVYAFELSVRTSFLDLSHGFVSGTSVFMYVNAYKHLSGQLTVLPYKAFKRISTALPAVTSTDSKSIFSFSDYDQLVDCPIEIGNHEVFSFKAAGIEHTVAMYGSGNYSIPVLKTEMAKIINETSKVIGENPNQNYTFIVHNVVDGQGGLEHSNSATLSVNRWTYQGDALTDFLSLVAHEYFHLWNVKRIRPIQLGPFNYDEENYTTLLWVMEGFTSYYDELLLLRAGYLTTDQYLYKLQAVINYVEGSVGSRVQPVAHASFDAWIKGYRPTENSSNTSMTYYSRGTMLAALIDVMIIDHYKGKKHLDDFLRVLYTKYYKELKRGFTENEFQRELELFLDQDLNEFFTNYVYGTAIAPLKEVFAKVGIDVADISTETASLGATVQPSGNTLMVKQVRTGSAAEQAGLSVNDEIIAVNGYRVDQGDFESFIGSLSLADQGELLISRDQVMMTIPFKLSMYKKYVFKLNPTFNDAAKVELRKSWLK